MRLGVEAALVDGLLLPGDVEVVDGRIARVGLSGSGGRGLAVPGFIDLQVNGFGGVDFLDADAAGYRRAGDALLETGVTAYLPTLITAPEERLVAALAVRVDAPVLRAVLPVRPRSGRGARGVRSCSPRHSGRASRLGD